MNTGELACGIVEKMAELANKDCIFDILLLKKPKQSIMSV